MTTYVRRVSPKTTSRTLLIGDPQTGLVHVPTCRARPRHGVEVGDRQTALIEGYQLCSCATTPLVADTQRIRALLATVRK